MAISREKCVGSHVISKIVWSDHLWLGGTTYGAIDSPAGPSLATIEGLARPVLRGPSVACQFLLAITISTSVHLYQLFITDQALQ